MGIKECYFFPRTPENLISLLRWTGLTILASQGVLQLIIVAPGSHNRTLAGRFAKLGM